MVSALEALLAEERKSGITTNSKHFDKLFGEGDHGGIPIGAVTEICGMAGLGKVWIRALSAQSIYSLLFIFCVL